MVIIFRCDASLSIGSGHVIRCRTLARELVRFGAEVVFLCRRQPGDLIAILEQEFRVLILPELPLVSCENLDGRNLYSSWLGCSQLQDADQTVDLILSSEFQKIDWVVVDHYGIDAVWENRLTQLLGESFSPQLFVIDDLADRPHQAVLLLDQNFVGTGVHTRYSSFLPTSCRTFLGPYYALLGPEYSRLHALVPARTELQRVLVFFSGVDIHNLTVRALEALMSPELSHLAVDVVLGHQSPHRKTVADLVSRRPLTTLHEPLPSLAALMIRADLAVGACGVTAIERACLGLPSLVVAIAKNQFPFAQALDQAGFLQLLGHESDVHAQHIADALKARLDFSRSANCSIQLTDGFGTARLAMAMLRPTVSITLRFAELRDEALLLHWANDPDVRANSFSHDLISPEDHHRWFEKVW